MTSVFGADGKNIPCTVIEAGPCVVTQLKTVEKDGYKAAQVGFMHKSEKHTNKAEAGHFKAAGVEPMRHLAEFEFDGELTLGQTITAADIFEEGMFVDVIGTSKGHGFQGVVKRHGFGGVGPKSVNQLVFPCVGALCNRLVLRVDENGLDAGRAKLDTENGFTCFYNLFWCHIISGLYSACNTLRCCGESA